MLLAQALLFVAGIFFAAYRRDISSRKNGVFYGKGNKAVTDPKILKWISNIHIVTNQGYRSWWLSLFCLTSAFLLSFYSWLPALLYSLIIVTLTSSSVSAEWQKWINLGSGLEKYDPNEKRSWELTLFDRSYWIPKFWYGKRRLYISWISRILLTGFLFWILYK